MTREYKAFKNLLHNTYGISKDDIKTLITKELLSGIVKECIDELLLNRKDMLESILALRFRDAISKMENKVQWINTVKGSEWVNSELVSEISKEIDKKVLDLVTPELLYNILEKKFGKENKEC